MDAAWALIATGLLLVVLELAVPGGVLALIGMVCLFVAAVFVWMEHGAAWGLATVAGGLLAGIIITFAELALLRRSPLARRVFLLDRNPATANAAPPDESKVVGRTGEAATTMAPTGIVVIDGQRYEASSQDGLLEKGTPVQVVGRDAFRIVVRRA